MGTTALLGVESEPFPASFLAFTTNVYEVPFVNPVTFLLKVRDESTIILTPPGVTVISYPVMALPPSSDGADQLRSTLASPTSPATSVGTPGTVIWDLGVAGEDGRESALLPTEFTAFTVN